jgi:hypothetical protein
MQPEFLATVQVLTGLRRDFTNRLVLDRTLEIEDREIAHLQCALRHIHKIGGLITQTFDRFFDCLYPKPLRPAIAPESLVIRKLKLRRSDHSGAKPHRFVVAKLNVFNVRQRCHTQLFLFDCFVITF